MSGTATQPAKVSPAQLNQLIRESIYRYAQPITQQVTSKTFPTVATGANTMTINPLQVGFLRRFLIVVTGTVTNGNTATVDLTPNGADNLLSNIQFSDFTGNARHNASGRSFSYVEAAKYGRIPGAALTSDSVSGFGSIIPSDVAPASLAVNATGTITRVFEVPIMVDMSKNMAGGMWLGVNNQSTLLTLTLNPTPGTTTDPLPAIYAGASNVTLTNVTVTVYQEYWNLDPRRNYDKNGNPVLPPLDISTAYMITEVNSGLSLSAGNAAFWNYPTFSKLLGTYFTYDNDDTLNAGSDVTEISLVLSNYAYVRQTQPFLLDRLTRDIVKASYPKGTYALMSRMHPLDVEQYPSLQLKFVPSSVGSGAYVMLTTELLRKVQYLTTASGVSGV